MATALGGLAVVVGGCGDSSSLSATTIIEANLDTQAALIGGATSVAVLYDDGTTHGDEPVLAAVCAMKLPTCCCTSRHRVVWSGRSR